MTAPIRPKIYALTEFAKEPEDMTLRDALQWFKRCVSEGDLDTARPLESKYLNERWAFLVSKVAEREGVPTGSLSYYLGELAQAEIDLAQTAEVESQAAGLYPDKAQ